MSSQDSGFSNQDGLKNNGKRSPGKKSEVKSEGEVEVVVISDSEETKEQATPATVVKDSLKAGQDVKEQAIPQSTNMANEVPAMFAGGQCSNSLANFPLANFPATSTAHEFTDAQKIMLLNMCEKIDRIDEFRKQQALASQHAHSSAPGRRPC
jgi:hypothetical protein